MLHAVVRHAMCGEKSQGVLHVAEALEWVQISTPLCLHFRGMKSIN